MDYVRTENSCEQGVFLFISENKKCVLKTIIVVGRSTECKFLSKSWSVEH